MFDRRTPYLTAKIRSWSGRNKSMSWSLCMSLESEHSYGGRWTSTSSLAQVRTPYLLTSFQNLFFHLYSYVLVSMQCHQCKFIQIHTFFRVTSGHASVEVSPVLQDAQ